MSEEIKDIMDALENNELKNDGFWGRACSRLSQQLQTAKEENEKLMEQLNTKYLEWEETFMENQNLTQQNKQMSVASTSSFGTPKSSICFFTSTSLPQLIVFSFHTNLQKVFLLHLI